MTIGKMTALSLGLVGGFALGVWTGPYVTQRAGQAASAVHETVTIPGTNDEAKPAVESRSPRAAVTPKTARVEAAAPALQERLKPVLNRGANLSLAAEGFRSAEQFATVAHAARNTEVPFVLLKHRVLNEGKSVAQAIRESKPAVNAAVEADLARAQARSDVALIAS